MLALCFCTPFYHTFWRSTLRSRVSAHYFKKRQHFGVVALNLLLLVPFFLRSCLLLRSHFNFVVDFHSEAVLYASDSVARLFALALWSSTFCVILSAHAFLSSTFSGCFRNSTFWACFSVLYLFPLRFNSLIFRFAFWRRTFQPASDALCAGVWRFTVWDPILANQANLDSRFFGLLVSHLI